MQRPSEGRAARLREDADARLLIQTIWSGSQKLSEIWLFCVKWETGEVGWRAVAKYLFCVICCDRCVIRLCSRQKQS